MAICYHSTWFTFLKYKFPWIFGRNINAIDTFHKRLLQLELFKIKLEFRQTQKEVLRTHFLQTLCHSLWILLYFRILLKKNMRFRKITSIPRLRNNKYRGWGIWRTGQRRTLVKWRTVKYKNGWEMKNGCFQIMVLEKIWESPELQKDQISQS